MLRLIFLLITLICFTIPYIALFGYKFGKALPLSFISLTFVIFVCSLLNNFSLFKYFVICIDVVILLLLFICNKKYREKLCEGLSRYSILVFVIIFVSLYFILQERMYVYVDDYYFWGPLVRDSIRNSSLYVLGNTYMNIGSYPPFLTLLEISFCKILGASDFVDGFSMLAVSSFSISLFMHLLDKYELKSKINIQPILVSLIIIACTLIISSNDDMRYCFLYNTTLIDWAMGFLFGYCMYLSFVSEGNKYDSICLGICCSALILIKQVSLPLTLLVLTTYLFLLLFRNKLKKNYLLSLIIPFVLYFIWQIQVNLSFGSTPLDGSVGVVGNSVGLLGSDTTKTIISRFINAFFTKPVMKHPFNLSFFLIMLIVTLLMVIKGVVKKEKKYYMLGAFAFLGGLGYSLMMLISYISVFNYTDGMTLVCFGRYMQTYTLGLTVLLVFVLLEDFQKTKQMFILLMVLCLFVEPTSISTLKRTDMEENKFYKFKNTFTDFYNYTYKNEKIVVLYSTSIAGVKMINYVMDKENPNFDIFNSVDNDNSCEEFKNRLKNAKYLIVVDSNNDFWENTYQLFQDEFILDESIYTVNFDNNGEVFLLRL